MNWAQQDFDELGKILATHPQFTPDTLSTMLDSPEPDTARNGFALMAARLYGEGKQVEALALLESAESRFTPLLPLPLWVLKIGLRWLLEQKEDIVTEYFRFGCAAAEAGQWELALEALGTALVNDGMQTMTILHSPERLRRVTDIYERAAQSLVPPAPHFVPDSVSRRLRVGMLVSSLVDDTVAYARRLMAFARRLDFSRYEFRVYITESICARPHQLPVFYASHPTPDRAPRFLKELEQRQIPVTLASRETAILDTARQVAGAMAADALDVLLIQSGPAAPIDWLVSRLASAPVKLHIHIGMPLYQRGVDATLFDNAVNMEREAAAWPDYAGARLLLRRGTDIEELDRLTPAVRAEWGLPEEAVLIGVLSNRLHDRLSVAYAEVIGAVLRECPSAWFVAIGAEKAPARARAVFERLGVWSRARFLPQQSGPGRVLKMLDIYANEFPAGGSQAVVEAMACGLPVAAMRSGDTHHESVGADIVGTPTALDRPDPDAYRQLLIRWVGDEPGRRAVGQALRRRAEAEFSIERYIKSVCELAETLWREKR